MKQYQLKSPPPVVAFQINETDNEELSAYFGCDIICYSPQFTEANGYLSGEDWSKYFTYGDWVVESDSAPVIMSDEDFRETYEEIK